MKRILLSCWPSWKRHRWRYVKGTMATDENMYFERRCLHCHRYESEVR